VTLEAKRSGLPSVVTPTGSLPDVVTHDVDGWVTRDCSAEALAEGLEHLLVNPQVLARASAAAQRSGELYNRERFAGAWGEVFGLPRELPAVAGEARVS